MSAFLMPQVSLSNLAYEFLRLHGGGKYLLDLTLPRGWGLALWPEGRRLERVFQILLAENVRSLRKRYGRMLEGQIRRAKEWTAIEPSEAYGLEPIDAPSIIRLCQCYAYQAGETWNYGHTAAAWITRMTRQAAVEHLIRQHASPEHSATPLARYLEEA